jgi:hypothetical protein
LTWVGRDAMIAAVPSCEERGEPRRYFINASLPTNDAANITRSP